MIDQLLLTEINKYLGKGKPTARNNYSFICPFCKHSKPKLEICLDKTSPYYQNYNCWVCNEKGKSINSLFKKLNINFRTDKKINSNLENKKITKIELPSEFKTFINNKSYIGYKALKYLINRNISREDILKYNIGYCEEGIYKNRIIIPSYDSEGKLNYFTARSFDNNQKKYINPEINRKEIIPFEFFINWNLPIILCEGPFDAIAIKRNSIPLLGKSITSALMEKIFNSKVNKIYIALDSDAIKKSLEICEWFMNQNKQIYLVELNKKDPSELGFVEFTNIIQQTKKLTLSKLMEKKLQLI